MEHTANMSTDIWDCMEQVSLTEYDACTELNRAGMDDCTPVDTFLNANGNFIFVTEV